MADSTLSQNDKQKLEDDMNTHHTCIPVGQAVQLKKCDKINCNCQNVHCPFCDTDHFRPAKPTRVRDHLELKHFAHAVQFNDFLIVKCFTKCGDKPACHYHCPVCHTKILKRKAFTKHMKGHAVNLKMGSVAVMAPDDKTPQKIVAYDEGSDTVEIVLCTETCPDTSGAHFHCPFCEKTSSDRSMIVIHLWRCKDLKSIDLKKKDELKGDNPFFPVEGIVHPKDNPDIKWHKSIVRNLNDLPLTPCDRNNCCGGKYHCDLCEIDKFQPAFHVHASVHQMSHWRKRTTIGDYAVLPCFLSCEIAQGSTIQLRSHYHCPVCGESRRRRTGFLHHIKICQGTRYDTLRYAMAKSQKLKEMFENGDGLNVDETMAVTEKLNRDVVTEEEPSNHQSDTLTDNFGNHQFDTLADNSNLQPVENFQFETKPISPPIPLMESVELQPDINKTEHRESDKTIEEIDLSKVEIFEQVTAKITEGLLRAVGSDKMTSIIEETASSIGVAYSSSPGVTSAVYNVTGELEQLVEVKKAIRKIICPSTWTDEVESSSFIENSGTGDISSNNVTDKDEADIQPVEGDKHNSKLKRRKSKRKGTSSRSAVDLETDSKLKKARTESQDKGSNIEHVSQSKRGKEKSKKEKANIPPAERETDVKVKRYSTRGIKVDFASLLSGKEQNRNMVTCKGRQSNAQTSDKKEKKNEQDNSDECNIRDDKFSEEHENIGEKSLQDRDVDDEDDSGDDDKDDSDDDDNDFQLDTDNDSDFELSSKKKQRKKSAVMSCVNDDGGNVAYIPPVIFVGVKVQKRKFRQGIRGKTKDHKQNSFETSIELKKSSNGTISELSCDKGTAADDKNDDIAEITLNAEKKINKITETGCSGTNACDMMSFKRKGVKKFVCRHCGSQCCDFVSLTSHLKAEHQDMETWRCDVCEREFNKEYHLDRHLVLKHGPMEERADITGRFVCKICIKSFYNEISLAKHTAKMHSAGEKELNILQKSKEEEYVMCEVCGKRFITSSHLQVHKQAIHQPQSFSCDICGKSFSHTRYLQSHIKRHKGDKKKECPTCGVRFVDSNTLRAHMETHKNPEDRVYNYICSYCGKKHNNKSFHLDHINKHTGNRPHACQICSRTFAFRSALSKHMFYIHSTEKPFKCTYCDKAFKLKRLLENHIVTHTGESSYVCEKCNKSFSCNYTLKQHNRKCKSVIMTSDLAQRLGVTFVVTSAPNFVLEPSSNNVESSILLNPGQMKEQQVISLPLQESMETASDVIEVVSSLGNQNSLPPHDSNVKEPSGQDMTGEPEAEVYVCSECNASFISLAVAEEHVLTSHMDLTDIEHEVDQSIQLEDLETVRVILTGENTIETGE